MIRGTTVTLYEVQQAGEDELGVPITTATPVTVENVLIGEPSTDDLSTSLALYQKRISYMLGIPKGDQHNWKDTIVEWTDAYGTHRVKTFGFPITGIEANVPGKWHMKVRCEAFE